MCAGNVVLLLLAMAVAPETPGRTLEGPWLGREVEEASIQNTALTFEAGRGVMERTIGSLSVSLPLRSLKATGQDVVFTVALRGTVRRYQGSWSGEKIAGKIFIDTPAPREIGTFELVRPGPIVRAAPLPSSPPAATAGPETAKKGGALSGSIPSAREPEPAKSEMDRLRQQGRERLAQALARISQQAGTLVTIVEQYSSACSQAYADEAVRSRCDQMVTAVGQLAVAVGKGLEQAEEDARRSWVEPGVVRELREQHGLDDRFWDDLSAKVRALEEEARRRR